MKGIKRATEPYSLQSVLGRTKMTFDEKKPETDPSWRRQVHVFFNEKKLSPDARHAFRASLLEAMIVPVSQPQPPRAPLATRWRSVVISSLVSATVAASSTFVLLQNPFEETPDPIAELTQLPGPKVYPPDFDLEGDSRALQDIVLELFSDKDFFVSKLPAHLLAEYKPSEGRFFSWDGEPAVSIQMNASNTPDLSQISTDPATLFIVKLSEKSKQKFPKEKTTRKVAGRSGKLHKVKVWREGKYGYAMVQSSTITDTTP